MTAQATGNKQRDAMIRALHFKNPGSLEVFMDFLGERGEKLPILHHNKGLTLRKAEELNKARGMHWFDRDTMRWWNCRIDTNAFDKWGLFSYSNNPTSHGPRFHCASQIVTAGACESLPGLEQTCGLTREARDTTLENLRWELQWVRQDWRRIALLALHRNPTEQGQFTNTTFVEIQMSNQVASSPFEVSRMTPDDGAEYHSAITYKGVLIAHFGEGK